MAERSTSPARKRGQALVETALVVVVLTFLVMGIVEAAWAFMRTSMIMHSARDGARYGATLESSLRDGVGCFVGGGITQIQNRVNDQLSTVGFTGGVAVCQACDGVIPITRVTVTGDLPMVFGFLKDPGTGLASFPVNRAVTFEDELRKCPDNPCSGCP